MNPQSQTNFDVDQIIRDAAAENRLRRNVSPEAQRRRLKMMTQQTIDLDAIQAMCNAGGAAIVRNEMSPETKASILNVLLTLIAHRKKVESEMLWSYTNE